MNRSSVPFRIFAIGLLSIALICFTITPLPVKALSSEKQGAISQNCATIKQSLKNLQRVDSKTRTLLGSTYEVISTSFLIPLNLRLVRNNQPNTELSEIQTQFTSEQSKFKQSYTDYMRDLENLLTIDCKIEPERFYDHLKVTRDKRQALQKNSAELLKLVQQQLKVVKKIRENL